MNDNDSLRPYRDVRRFNQWAPAYDRSIMQRLLFGPVHTGMLDLLKREGPKTPPGCILDVGCGTGRLLRAVSKLWPEAQLWGADPSEKMLAQAMRLNSGPTFQRAFAEELPFPDQSADLVLSSISFHHWADQKKGLQEIARVLRPGGYFCLADHVVLPARLLGEKVRTRKEIRLLMKSAGLQVRRQQGMGIRFVLITLARKL